jgi:uncharacterized membrane protein (UPF0127 family)
MSGASRYVQLRHSDGRALPLRVRRCHTFLCRLRGLTFRRALAPDEGLLFVEQAESRAGTSIHMFFVFFSIGVVWLASDGAVVDARLAKPFRPFYAPRAPAKYYLEGPPALLSWVRLGERLSIEPSVESP